MSDEQTQQTNETKPIYFQVKLDGQNLVNVTSLIKNPWERCLNQNYVYLNSNTSDIVDKTQLYIQPKTLKVKIGRARIQGEKGDWTGGNLKMYDVWLNTSVKQVSAATVGGWDYNMPEYGDETIIPPTDDEQPEQGENGGNNNTNTGDCPLATDQYYDMLQTMSILEPIFTEEIVDNYSVYISTSESQTPVPIFGFSYQNNLFTDLKEKSFNCIRFLNKEQHASGDVHLTIRKCNNDIDMDEFNKMLQYKPNDTQNPDLYNDRFEYLYRHSKFIAASRNKVNQSNIAVNDLVQFMFSRPISLEIADDSTNELGLYLFIFQSDKSLQLSAENTRLMKVPYTTDSQTTFNRMYNMNLDEDNSQCIVSLQFCNKTPIGLKFK